MMADEEHIDRDAGVREFAARLGIGSTSGLRHAITEAVAAKIANGFSEHQITPVTLSDVHRFVGNHTRMRVARVEDDRDVAKLADQYGRPAVQLELELSKATEALVLRTGTSDARGAKFVAIVDARGPRQHRAWFSERHEQAHALVQDPMMEVGTPRRTSFIQRDPCELVVDAVASAVGFWEPIVRPVVLQHLGTTPCLLSAFERAHADVAPDASVEASYRAFIRYVERPIFLFDNTSRPRRADERDGGIPLDSLALRVRTRIFNPAAEAARLIIHSNYRVPLRSVAAQACQVPDMTLSEYDNLSCWPTASGSGLPDLAVKVTARGRWAMIEPL